MKLQIDERWDDVAAYMGPPQGGLPDSADPIDYIEVLIEVCYDEQVFYSKQIVDKEALKDAKFNLLNWVLDEMVESLDNFINHWEETGEHVQSS